MKNTLLFFLIISIQNVCSQVIDSVQTLPNTARMALSSTVVKSSKNMKLTSVDFNYSVRLEQILNEINTIKKSMNSPVVNEDSGSEKINQLKSEYLVIFKKDVKLIQTYHVHYFNKFKKERE